jgi:hypothetical protein
VASGPPKELLRSDTWSDRIVQSAGVRIVDVPVVLVGGGLGSFVFADYLRLAGVPAPSIRVLSAMTHPWESYQYLAETSQIADEDRLRSDSQSTPDNPWGFPSYAFREVFGARSPRKFLAPLWHVLTEPILSDYFTPQSGQVFRGLRREADRIDWWQMVDLGHVRLSRRREGGGYFTLFSPVGESSGDPIAYRSRFVHVAVGYPGLGYLPDLQAYREKYRDFVRVVNAYEPHEHVYESLKRPPGTVIVRGRGIVASRVLQRLIDDRDRDGAKTSIVHLFRTYTPEPQGANPFMRRPASDGWSYQGFNVPKASWGGQLKVRLESASPEHRQELYDVIGGTTTARRREWQRQLARGRREGWYQAYAGEICEMVPGEGGVVRTRVSTAGGILEIAAQFVIDTTGLESDIRKDRLLADLLDHSGVATNVLGRLEVERTFELKGARSGDGRMYAVGAATFGGPYAGVDTFLGLQYSALMIVDDLARMAFCRRIGAIRSIKQWWLWMLNRPIGVPR